ncbi:MAG: NAD(P)-dependent alcohol dehydrogenase [Bacteroidia bacterium]
MKAIVYSSYGKPEVLSLADVNTPAPKGDEILIRIHATAVNSADIRLRAANPSMVRLFWGLFRPKNPILGGVFSGEIVGMGPEVKRFKVGDAVFGLTTLKMGAYGEYLSISEKEAIARKPENLSHAEAASLPFGGHTAWHFFKKAKIQSGSKVLIYGASGAVGCAAVQFAKHFGAEVTAVCSARNAETMRSIGADHVLDYAKDDLGALRGQFDVVMETVDRSSVRLMASLVKKGGMLILSAAMMGGALFGLMLTLFGGKRLGMGMVKAGPEDMEAMANLAAQGRFRPVIDRVMPMEQIVEAHRYVDLGHKRGNLIISMA